MTSIDHLFGGKNKPKLIQRVVIDNYYLGQDMTSLTVVYDSGPQTERVIHVQKIVARVGGNLGEKVAKGVRIQVGTERETTLYFPQAYDTEATVEAKINDIWVTDRLVVSMQTSTVANGFTGFYLEGYVYEL